MKIPIIVGVTGHRNIRKEDIETLRSKVRSELQRFVKEYPNTQITIMNSLAEGADQLSAEIAIELSIPIIVPLPMELDMYREDFEGDSLETFNRLLNSSKNVFIAPNIEKREDKSRDYCYRQAGLYIVRNCHVLLALWDGISEGNSGCGTATFVELKTNDVYFEHDSILKTMCGGIVMQIVTPREAQPVPADAFSTRIFENPKGSLKDVLKKTDEYNSDITNISLRSNQKSTGSSMLDTTNILGNDLHCLYVSSDHLSVYFRDKYLKSLKCLSFCGVALVVSFLLYDELESDVFLILYGILILLTFTVYAVSRKRRYHSKYLEYRALAETARVHHFMALMNLKVNICDGFNWTQSNSWIQQAVSTLMVGSRSEISFDFQKIKTIWIDGQLSYYRGAIMKTKRALSMNTVITNAMITASITLFLIVSILEFGYKNIVLTVIPMDSVRSFLIIHEGQVLIFRGLLKIILGLVSATTIFLSNYYDKLSLRSKLSEYERMIAIYSAAKIRFEDPEIPKERMFLELAKEEMIENGNWLRFSSSNEVEINI